MSSRFFKWHNTAITDSDVFAALTEDDANTLFDLFGDRAKQAASDDGIHYYFINTVRKEITPMKMLSYAFGGQYNDDPPYGTELEDFPFEPSEYKMIADVA